MHGDERRDRTTTQRSRRRDPACLQAPLHPATEPGGAQSDEREHRDRRRAQRDRRRLQSGDREADRRGQRAAGHSGQLLVGRGRQDLRRARVQALPRTDAIGEAHGAAGLIAQQPRTRPDPERRPPPRARADTTQRDDERSCLDEARNRQQQRGTGQRERVHRPVERGEITTPRPQREGQRGDHADGEKDPSVTPSEGDRGGGGHDSRYTAIGEWSRSASLKAVARSTRERQPRGRTIT